LYILSNAVGYLTSGKDTIRVYMMNEPRLSG
jgi:hypothetical protein